MQRSVVIAAVLALPLALAGCASWLLAKHDPSDVHVDRSPANVARGEYLVQHAADCFDCHSPVNEAHQGDPALRGAGGRLFGREDGLPGEVYSSNLTSDAATGLGNWTDGEVLRALREGVSKDGHALFPIMPYASYRHMSDADAYAVVAYLRTLAPVRHEVPARKLDFPLNLIVNVIPKPLDGPVAPPPADPLARGKYLFTIGSCADCHTPRDSHGQPLPGMQAAGGMKFHLGPGLDVPSANITPDRETGIGSWTDAQIAAAITQGMRPDGQGLRPVMPWPAYSRLEPVDVQALVAYVRTLAPVKHDVGKRR